jgi:hypothetical protein
MDDAARERLTRKLQLTLELHDDGVAMMRLNLRRRFPDENDDQIRARVRAWLQDQPAVEQRDGFCQPAAWPRRRA